MNESDIYREQRNAMLEYQRRQHLAGREAWLRGVRQGQRIALLTDWLPKWFVRLFG